MVIGALAESVVVANETDFSNWVRRVRQINVC